MEKSSGLSLVIHKQQEHNRGYEGGRTVCVLQRCLLSAFSATAFSTVGLHVAFEAPTSILTVSMDTAVISHRAIWHTRTGLMQQLSLYFVLITSPNIQTLFFHKNAEVCQPYTGQ